MDFLRRLFGASSMVGWAWATLVVQSGIIVTGATVRVTGSGLGCPTWPRCTDESYFPHPEHGIHGVIEFGNRLLTFVLILVAFATFAAALAYLRRNSHHGRRVLVLAIVIALGVPIQAVVGGITVHTQLNPFVVAPHLLLSVGLVALSTWLLHSVSDAPRTTAGPRTNWLVRGTWAAMMVSIWLGTLVTGSGPHAGDENAPRTGFDIEFVSRLHAGSVWLLVALTIACVIVLRNREAWVLLIVELLQGLVGYIQYFTGVPVGLVIVHMVGIPVCTAAGTWLLLTVQRSEPIPAVARPSVDHAT